MNRCHCEATERHFDAAHAREDLDRYQRKGPDTTTRILLDALKSLDLRVGTLLDIGGGIGVLPLELLPESVSRATLVEASPSYLEAAEAEAGRRGLRERITFVRGDFVQRSDQLPPADLVSLDRVVCCYPDFERLLASSSVRARKWLALSFPRDRWYVKLDTVFKNWRRRRRGNPFRTYVHAEVEIHDILTAGGFRLILQRAPAIWDVRVYARSDGS